VFVSPAAVSFNRSFNALLDVYCCLERWVLWFKGALPIIFSLKECFVSSGTSTILSVCSTIVGFNSSLL
jgi:hypothetical protein